MKKLLPISILAFTVLVGCKENATQKFEVVAVNENGAVCKYLSQNAFSGNGDDLEYIQLPEQNETYTKVVDTVKKK